MKATTSVDKTSITHNLAATGDTDGGGNPARGSDAQTGKNTGKPESELRAVARRRGLNLKELAHLMGVSYRYLCQVSNGHRPWSPMMRERALAVLGEVPGQGMVYRQDGEGPRWKEHLHPGASPAAAA